MTKRTHRIQYEAHGTWGEHTLRFTGVDQASLAGAKVTVYIDIAALDPEERYNLGRSLSDWANRLTDRALGAMADEAQMALFAAHTAELNRFAPPR